MNNETINNIFVAIWLQRVEHMPAGGIFVFC